MGKAREQRRSIRRSAIILSAIALAVYLFTLYRGFS